MINDIYRKAAESNPERKIKFTMEQNVSTDLIGVDATVIIEGQFNHTRTALLIWIFLIFQTFPPV